MAPWKLTTMANITNSMTVLISVVGVFYYTQVYAREEGFCLAWSHVLFGEVWTALPGERKGSLERRLVGSMLMRAEGP